MHEDVDVVIFAVAKVEEVTSRMGRIHHTCTVTQCQIDEMTTSSFFLHFISVTVWCATVVYYMVIFRLLESFLVDNKAQESGSRKVSSDSPGKPG